MAMCKLSEQIGFQPKSLSTILSRHQHITIATLSKICEALSCQPGDVFEFVDEIPKRKRVLFREDWQYSSEDFVIVNWEKVLSDLKAKGYSMNRASLEMGKDGNWIALRKGRKYTKKTVIKQIADFLGKSLEEYL